MRRLGVLALLALTGCAVTVRTRIGPVEHEVSLAFLRGNVSHVKGPNAALTTVSAEARVVEALQALPSGVVEAIINLLPQAVRQPRAPFGPSEAQP